MEEQDIVRESTLGSVREITRRRARRVISASIASGLVGGLLFAGLVYFFTHPDQQWLAVACIVIFTGIGGYEAVKWYKHYRSIETQLDALEARVWAGEVIYASQFKFHSSR